MASPLEDVPWEPCLIEPRSDRALESYSRRKMGIPNPAIPYFSAVPWLARAMVDLRPEYGLLVHLDADVADLVALAVSQENSCRFCYAAVRMLLWALGMSRARIQRLEQDLTRADLPPRTVAAIAFARDRSRAGHAADDGARQALRRAGFSDEEVNEIAYDIAATHFSNRVHTIPAIPCRPLERMPDRLHVRLCRPLIGRILRRHRPRGRATPLDRVPPAPYGGLVTAFAGSPIAPALAKVLEEMWASRHLTRRCKLLIFVVVARGLGCDSCVVELGRALQAEALDDAALTQVVHHLDAPELDDLERLIVPFARETIWYEPDQLQRRARALRDRLSPPQFLEAIGVASLANGLCRMGAMVLHHA